MGNHGGLVKHVLSPEFTAQALEKKWRSDGCMSNEIIVCFHFSSGFMYKLKIPPSPHGKFASNFSEVAFVFCHYHSILKEKYAIVCFFNERKVMCNFLSAMLLTKCANFHVKELYNSSCNQCKFEI